MERLGTRLYLDRNKLSTSPLVMEKVVYADGQVLFAIQTFLFLGANNVGFRTLLV